MPIQTQGLYFSYSDDQVLLQGVELHLHDGCKIALTGPNGCGKSTLLRLLANEMSPQLGQILMTNQAHLVEQHRVINDSPLSGGEARIAALRHAFSRGPSTLLLDEPTNDLDENAKAWLLHAIELHPGALVIVSHDPDVLDRVDEILELKAGRLLRHPPGYSRYLDRLDEEERRLKAQVQSLQAESRKVESHARSVVAAQEKRMARGKKAGIKSNLPKIVRGAKKRQAQMTLAKVEGAHADRIAQAKTESEQARQRLRQLTMFKWDFADTQPPAGRRLLRVEDLRLQGLSGTINFEMIGPRRLHIKGKNGSGKSTLLRALCGEPGALRRVSGTLSITPAFQLFDQDLTQFAGHEPLWTWFQNRMQLDLASARTVLGRLGFDQDEQERPVSALSGGERVRMELAIALKAKLTPQLLLLDEPTNHLDIESRRILQSFATEFRGGLVVVSHDRRFLSSIQFDAVIDLDTYR